MSDVPICTLIHISDPHFGDGFVLRGRNRLRNALKRVPILKEMAGLYPHDYQIAGAAAVAVKTLLRDRAEAEVPAMVVHTGDLTASGAAAQFSVGQTYFRHGHYLENGTVCGLGMDTEFKRSVFDIPGNHDLWSRSAPRDHAAFTSHYGGHYPRRDSIRTKRGSVHLYGLDSNRSSLLNHRMANGEIPTEAITSVCEEMRRNASPTAVQVVCLHHPLTDGPEPNRSGTMGLQDCEKIATEFSQAGAGVILAGHVHRQRACLHQGMLHLTAGSLCQAGEQPSFWLLDFYRSKVKYTHFEVPSGAIHFAPVESKSGEHALGRSPERR